VCRPCGRAAFTLMPEGKGTQPHSSVELPTFTLLDSMEAVAALAGEEVTRAACHAGRQTAADPPRQAGHPLCRRDCLTPGCSRQQRPYDGSTKTAASREVWSRVAERRCPPPDTGRLGSASTASTACLASSTRTRPVRSGLSLRSGARHDTALGRQGHITPHRCGIRCALLVEWSDAAMSTLRSHAPLRSAR